MATMKPDFSDITYLRICLFDNATPDELILNKRKLKLTVGAKKSTSFRVESFLALNVKLLLKTKLLIIAAVPEIIPAQTTGTFGTNLISRLNNIKSTKKLEIPTMANLTIWPSSLLVPTLFLLLLLLITLKLIVTQKYIF